MKRICAFMVACGLVVSLAAVKENKEHFRLRSDAFEDGKPIPEKFTGDGDDTSVPLAWSGVPEGTKSFALICEDPDAPFPEKPAEKPFVHWLIYNIPGSRTELKQGIPRIGEWEGGILQGMNSFKALGYGGPKPPPESDPHRYFFTLYALDVAKLPLGAGIDKEMLIQALEGHVVAQTTLIGVYKRAEKD